MGGDLASWVVSIASALTAGLILFLIAAGLSLVFGVLGILNFAHASFMLFGAYLTSQVIGQSTSIVRFGAALVVVPLAIAILGIVVEVLLLRRVYSRPHLTQLLVTFALVFILWGLIDQFWGSRVRSVPQPDGLNGSIGVLGRAIPQYYLAPLVVTSFVAAGMWLVVNRTRFGREMRASASNREVADIAGIDSRRMFTLVFGLGAWLAGVAGVLLAPMQALTPTADQRFILLAFIVVVIGGLGSIIGSLFGALAVALGNAIGAQTVPQITTAIPFLLMAIVLLLKPEGAFGKKDREV